MWERVLAHLINDSPTELWEWLFSRAMIEASSPKVFRPGEQFVDGIYLTPDGWHIEDMMLEEWKYTTKSAKNELEGGKFDRWIRYQIPCYLYALGLRKCRLRVYFARGNYSSPEPIWKEFILEYSEQEIAETWDMIVNNARELERQLMELTFKES